MNTRLRWWQQWMAAVLIAVMMQPWGAYRLMAADVTPGYTFTSGEANITHTKLNNATAGTIATTFYSGKSSAGANMTPGNYTLLGLDSVSGTYRRATLDQWVFDHSALIADRTVSTAPLVDYTLLLNVSGAYRQMSWTNWMFSGAGTGAVTNETRFPALRAGVASSLSLSNLIGAAFSHDSPTNGDEFLVLTENHNRAVRKLSLKNLITQSWPGTNYGGDYQELVYDGTRLRSMRATNFIDGLTVTNTVLATNDAIVVLQAGQLKKLFLNELRQFAALRNVQWAVNTNASTLAGSAAWADFTGLSVSITPRSTTSKVLVRARFNVDVDSVPAHFKLVRGSTDIGMGASDGASRIEATASIDNSTHAPFTIEWLDEPQTTSATTYKVQVYMSAGTLNINRSSTDANSDNHFRATSTILAEEIYQ